MIEHRGPYRPRPVTVRHMLEYSVAAMAVLMGFALAVFVVFYTAYMIGSALLHMLGWVL